MTLKDIINHFPNKYVCVHNTKLDARSLIKEADILCVFDTLRIATENAPRIHNYMKQYADFDIIYCDYQDYVSTRQRPAVPIYAKNFSINNTPTHPTENGNIDPNFMGTQDDITEILEAIRYQEWKFSCGLFDELPFNQ